MERPGFYRADDLADPREQYWGPPYFKINTSYYDSLGNHLLNAVPFPKVVLDNYSRGMSLSDALVKAVVKSHIGVDLPLGPNGVYFVLTTPDVNETSGFCTMYCGWHTYYTDPSGVQVKYALCPG